MSSSAAQAVVARSTFPSQNVQDTPAIGPLLEVELSKKCMPLMARSDISKSKCAERCLRSPLFRSLSLTIYLPAYLSIFYVSDIVSRGRRKGLWILSKVIKSWGSLSSIFICLPPLQLSTLSIHVHYTTSTSTTTTVLPVYLWCSVTSVYTSSTLVYTVV